MTHPTAATRPRINLQSYRKADGTYSAWTVLLYEVEHGRDDQPDSECIERPAGDS